jgi:DNA polymerase III epsilon subunit-like protein
MSYTTFFDTETGGVSPAHPTIQLAAVAIDDATWEEVSSFERKICFNEADCDPEALRLNHYNAAVWANEAKPADRVAAQFAFWAKPYLCIEMVSKAGNPYSVGKLAGHNALTFDLPRLRGMFGQMFFPFSYHVKDTLQRAMWFFDEHPDLKRPANLKLGTLCSHFQIPIDEGAHDALVDVRLSAALAKAIRDAETRRTNEE